MASYKRTPPRACFPVEKSKCGTPGRSSVLQVDEHEGLLSPGPGIPFTILYRPRTTPAKLYLRRNALLICCSVSLHFTDSGSDFNCAAVIVS